MRFAKFIQKHSVKQNSDLKKLLLEREDELRFAKESYNSLEIQHATLKETMSIIKADNWNQKQRLEELHASKLEHEKIAAQSNAEKSKAEATNNKLIAWNAELDAEKIRLEMKNKALELQNNELQDKLADENDETIRLHSSIKFLELKKTKLEQVISDQYRDFPISGNNQVVTSDNATTEAEVTKLKEQCILLEELNGLYENDIAELVKTVEGNQHRFAQLEEQVTVYKEFISQDRNDRITPRVEAQLKAVGLHKDSPHHEFVAKDYFLKIQQRGLSQNIRRSAALSHRDCEQIVWES
jgi:hypothetical protein